MLRQHILAKNLDEFKLFCHNKKNKKTFNLKGREWRKEGRKEGRKGGRMHYLSCPRGWPPPGAPVIAWQPPAGCPPLPAAHQLLHALIVQESASSLSLGPGWDYDGLQCSLILLTSSNSSVACLQLGVFWKTEKIGSKLSLFSYVHLVSQCFDHGRSPDCAWSPRVCSA